MRIYEVVSLDSDAKMTLNTINEVIEGKIYGIGIAEYGTYMDYIVISEATNEGYKAVSRFGNGKYLLKRCE